MNTNSSKSIARAVALAIVSCAMVAPALAGDGGSGPGEPSKQSNIGALTGLAVGAAAAGPVGAVVGAAAGAIIGDHYHRQQKAAAAANATLGRSEEERTRLANNLTQADATLAGLKEPVARAGQVGLDVSFRTDDDSIPEQTLEPLKSVGALAAVMPDTIVRVSGYADPRGSDAYNDALSMRRAQAVAAALTGAGVPAGRMIIESHGKSESQTEQGDLDGYAFDRRVTVRLEQAGAGQVASRD